MLKRLLPVDLFRVIYIFCYEAQAPSVYRGEGTFLGGD